MTKKSNIIETKYVQIFIQKPITRTIVSYGPPKRVELPYCIFIKPKKITNAQIQIPSMNNYNANDKAIFPLGSPYRLHLVMANKIENELLDTKIFQPELSNIYASHSIASSEICQVFKTTSIEKRITRFWNSPFGYAPNKIKLKELVKLYIPDRWAVSRDVCLPQTLRELITPKIYK